MNFAYLDIEVQRTAAEAGGYSRAAMRRRKLAVAVTWRKACGGYCIYREQDCQKLIEDLKAAECVVGFNCLSFDYEIMRGHLTFRKPRTLDLLDVIAQAQGFRVGLNALSQGTFGHDRSSDGNRNTALWQAGKQAAVERACERDVGLIRRLHERMIKRGWVAFIDRHGQRRAFEVPASVLAANTR